MYTFAVIFLAVLPPALLFGADRLQGWMSVPSPARILGVVLLLGYTPKALYMAYSLNTDATYRFKHVIGDTIHLGQALVVVSVMAMTLSYLIFLRPVAVEAVPDTGPRLRPRVDPTPLYVFFLAGATALMALFFYRMGFVDQISNLTFLAVKFFVDEETSTRSSLGFLTIGGDFIVVAFMYYLVMAGKQRRLNIYILLILFVSVTLLLASRRNGVMLILAAAVLCGTVSGVRIRLSARFRRFFIIGIGIVALILVAQIRDARHGGVTVDELNFANAFESTAEHLMKRPYFTDPAKLAMIVEKTDRHLYGTSFAAILVAPVPRLLWPGKPNVRIGPYVAQELFGLRTNSGIPPSAPGEFYLNFGWPGVVVGMALLGVLMARAVTAFHLAVDRKAAGVRYAFYMLTLGSFFVVDFAFAALLLIKFLVFGQVCERYWAWRRLRSGDTHTDGIAGWRTSERPAGRPGLPALPGTGT